MPEKKQILRVSPTLLDSFHWYLSCSPERPSHVNPQISAKTQAYMDVLQRLQRKKSPHTVETVSGQNIEDFINRIIDLKMEDDDKLSKTIMKYLNIDDISLIKRLYNYRMQEKIDFDWEIDGKVFHVRGNMDLSRHVGENGQIDHIIDIKSTKYFRHISYYRKWQAYFYMYATNCKNFQYFVFEWRKPFKQLSECLEYIEDSSLGDEFLTKKSGKRLYVFPEVKNVHKIDLLWHDSYKTRIIDGIRHFIEWVEGDKDLKAAYYDIYCKKT